jgi:DNA-binding transcriptional ArsR family regulator
MKKYDGKQAFECKCTPEDCKEIKKTATKMFEILNDQEGLKKQAAFFRALGNEVRLNLLGLLAVREMCICEIVEVTEGANSTVAHHLRLLTEGGLIDSRKEGKFTIFRLNNELIKKHNVLEESGTCC